MATTVWTQGASLAPAGDSFLVITAPTWGPPQSALPVDSTFPASVVTAPPEAF